jgi:hypothetical protein
LELILVQWGQYDQARKMVDALDDPDKRACKLKKIALELARLGDGRAMQVFDDARASVQAAQDQQS